MSNKTGSTTILLILFATILFFSACEGPFDLKTALGLDLEELTVYPNGTVVDMNSTIDFDASPAGSYVWSVVVGSGSIDPATGVYTPAGIPEYVTVQAVDPATGYYGRARLRFEAGVTLTLLADATTVYPGETIGLHAFGGNGGPYTYSIQTNISGAAAPVGTSYTAGATPGIDVLRVLDAGDAHSATLNITVLDPAVSLPDIDYTVSGSVLAPAASALGETILLGGSFDYDNVGTAGGGSAISWAAYMSTTQDLNGIVSQVDSGTAAALNPTDPAATVNFDVTWPTEPGNYHLVVQLIPGTDTDTSNNIGFTAASTALNVNYSVPVLPAGAPYTPSASTGVIFSLQNTGSVTGAADVYWRAYISNNAAFDAGDIQVDSGVVSGALIDPDEPITATVMWPSAGDTWVVFEYESEDDTAGVPEHVVAGPYTPPNVDYGPRAGFDPAGGNVEVGTDPGISVWMENFGLDAGTADIDWIAWLSPVPDTVPGNAGDLQLATGTLGAPYPASGGVQEIPLGIWNVAEGDYHLIVTWSAPDDINTTNDQVANPVGTPFSVVPRDVDYIAHTAPAGGGSVAAGTAIGESFILTNGATQTGTQAISWQAWMSEGDTTLDAGDYQIDSGLEDPTTWTVDSGLTSNSIPITGNWPSSGGPYSIIITWNASDDINTTNDSMVSVLPVSITTPVADYIVTNVTLPAGPYNAGSAVSGSFTVQNLGPQDDPGSGFTWAVYASTDTSFGAGDALVAMGSDADGQTVADGGVVISITGLGSWPETSGDYYLIAELWSDYDPDGSPAAVGVSANAETIINQTDYEISSVQYYDYGIPNQDLEIVDPAAEIWQFAPAYVPFEFVVTETSGVAGTRNIDYTVYASLDTVLDPTPTDYILSSGSIKKGDINGNGGTWTVDFGNPALLGNNPWPDFPGQYYLIVVINAADDSDAGNDILVAGPIYVATTIAEVDPNDGFYELGPPTTTPSASDSHSLDTSLYNGTSLLPGELVHVQGLMDASAEYDTFNFTVGPGMDQVTIEAFWGPALGDEIDLYLWIDSAPWYEFDSAGTDPDYEGTISVSGLTAGMDCYVGLYFYRDGMPIKPAGTPGTHEYFLRIEGSD